MKGRREIIIALPIGMSLFLSSPARVEWFSTSKTYSTISKLPGNIWSTRALLTSLSKSFPWLSSFGWKGEEVVDLFVCCYLKILPKESRLGLETLLILPILCVLNYDTVFFPLHVQIDYQRRIERRFARGGLLQSKAGFVQVRRCPGACCSSFLGCFPVSFWEL